MQASAVWNHVAETRKTTPPPYLRDDVHPSSKGQEMSTTQQEPEYTTDQKLSLFRSCFAGLDSVYGTYDLRTGRARQVKRPVDREVLLRHLTGVQPYGVYLLVGERTMAAVADFDDHDPQPPLRFVRRAAHYDICAYLERSKSKGWHTWILAERPGVTAAKIRSVVREILVDINAPTTEVFPKQDRLSDSAMFGNFIYAPLFARHVADGRTVFVDPDRNCVPFENQWTVLRTVRRVTEQQLDDVVEVNRLESNDRQNTHTSATRSSLASTAGHALPPCAQRMLAEGVTENQRVACFRLAIHLRRAGIPEDIAIGSLRMWACKNRPPRDKRIITPQEIEDQTRWAYARSYRGCGCSEPVVKPFCDPTCPIRAAGRLS